MFKRNDIITRSLADGSTLTVPVFTFEGKNCDAPRVYIQSSIHGAEVQGNGVILHLMDHFVKNPPYGTVVLVPNVNPFSINQRLGDYGYSRFDPNTGDNWNRLYDNITCRTFSEKTFDEQIVIEEFLSGISLETSVADVIKKLRVEIVKRLDKRLQGQYGYGYGYGKKLALQIQRMASEADIVLDLHCDTVSLPHLYAPNYAVDSAREFNIPYIISIPEKFAGALDEASFCPWFNLVDVWNDARYAKPHVEVFTLEFGSQEVLDLEVAKKQALGIIHYLATKQVCDDVGYERINSQRVCALANLHNIYAPRGGYISQFASLGKVVQAGESLLEILQIGDLNFSNVGNFDQSLLEGLITPVRASAPCIPIVRACSVTMHEGMPVMKVIFCDN